MNSSSRQLRIFISSTFRDMQQERDQLVKYVFPKLKKIASERFVDITEIDLRWGITEEEANSGETLKICLDEINKCKSSPIFFIGLLGNRYGWIPNDIDSKLFKDTKYRWMDEYKDKSVTELEILYAVLKEQSSSMSNESTPKKQFYFKGKSFDISNNQQNIHINKPDNKSFFYFRDENLSNQIENNLKIETQNDYSIENQNKLKNTIKNQDNNTYEYDSIENFSAQILADLINELDRLYPKNETPSKIDKIRLIHRQFANSRKKIYIKDQNIFNQIDIFMKSDIPYLTIQAESGMGKSSLIANYIEYYESNHRNDYIIEHYIGGADDGSADIKSVLFRILNELKELFDIHEDLPKHDELIDKFATYMYNLQSDKKIVIFIDAIDQLTSEDEKRLYFLPRLLPDNIKMIISSIDPIELEISTNITLTPLSHQNQIELINTYLNKFSKKLSHEQLNIILNSKQTNNALYLKALLDELRIYGEFDNFTLNINQLMQNKTVEDLFSSILRRIEQDVDHDSFIDILSLIWCSRDGLSEEEILEIINGISVEEFQDYINQGKKLKLTQIELSNIFLQLDDHIIYKDGLINFFHKYLNQAVKNSYLQSEDFQRKYRLILSYYFENYIVKDSFPKNSRKRVSRELPLCLLKLNEEEKLINTITHTVVFFYQDSEDWKNEILQYYLSISNIKNKDDEFSNLLIGNIQYYQIFMLQLSAIDFIKKNISWSIAKTKYEELARYFETDYNKAYINCLKELAIIYMEEENFTSSKKVILKALSISQKKYGLNHGNTINLLTVLANLYSRIKEHDKELEIREKLVFNKNLHKLEIDNDITLFNNLALTYEKIENKQYKARKLLEQILYTAIKRFGDTDRRTIKAMGDLLHVYETLELYELYSNLLPKYLQVSENRYGKNDIKNFEHLLVIIKNLIKEEKYIEAKKIILPLHDYNTSVLGTNHRDTKLTTEILALIEEKLSSANDTHINNMIKKLKFETVKNSVSATKSNI